MSCWFPEWIKDSPTVGLSVSRTFDSEGDSCKPSCGSTDLNEVVKTTKKEEVDAFSSKIIHSQIKTLLLENNMHVMTQSLKGGDQPHLPPCLSVVNTYTEVISGSKWVTVVVKNLMAASITIAKGIKVPQVVAVNAVPPVELTPDTLEKLVEI